MTNIGCMTQLADSIGITSVHTVELLDWATSGPQPETLRAARALPKDRDTARERVTA
jgi:hypothetical protein